jgi:hypothetical protein
MENPAMNLMNWQFAAKPGDFCNWKPVIAFAAEPARAALEKPGIKGVELAL